MTDFQYSAYRRRSFFRVDFKESCFAQPLGNYRATSQISNVQKCANLRIDSRIKRLISMMESIVDFIYVFIWLRKR
jgi:hypothetical protein